MLYQYTEFKSQNCNSIYIQLYIKIDLHYTISNLPLPYKKIILKDFINALKNTEYHCLNLFGLRQLVTDSYQLFSMLM